MPISWGVEHTARLVLATARGELSRADIEQYLDRLAAAATLSYSKVFHMDDCRLALTDDDLAAIGTKVRSFEDTRPMGPVAVIAVSDALYEQARMFDTMVIADRPLRIFRDAGAAYDWLASEPVEQPGVDVPLFPDVRLPVE